jgi:predicted TIM-barrel fold metal-dependent hydrolase
MSRLWVDVHLHLYPTRVVGQWWKSRYDIWEYGPKEDVAFSRASGTVEEAVRALRRGGFVHGVAVNLFSVDLHREEALAFLPPDLSEEERQKATDAIDASMGDRVRSLNRWLCDAVASVAEITPFVAADPWALSGEENVAHLQEMVERGARGVKLHPVAQRFLPDDPRIHPVYRACVELGLAVLAHSGPSRTGERYAEPVAFGPVLERFPDLTLILAHLGGATWRQVPGLAREFPQVAFDLSEVIHWTGAPNAPSEHELAALVREVGADRVLLGSDFPWYDPDSTRDRVLSLPGLSLEEKEAILGANAARLLGLPL